MNNFLNYLIANLGLLIFLACYQFDLRKTSIGLPGSFYSQGQTSK